MCYEQPGAAKGSYTHEKAAYHMGIQQKNNMHESKIRLLIKSPQCDCNLRKPGRMSSGISRTPSPGIGGWHKRRSSSSRESWAASKARSIRRWKRWGWPNIKQLNANQRMFDSARGSVTVQTQDSFGAWGTYSDSKWRYFSYEEQ